MVWAVAKRGSTRNGNNDGWQLDCSGTRADCCTLFVWSSVVAVQRWWLTVKGRNTTVRQETIKNCHSKLLITGSVTDARGSGRPSTSRSEKNVALVRDMFTLSPRKSTRQAAGESGLWRREVRTVLKKDLNFRPRKSHYVQLLTPEDCDSRMEYGELMLGWHEDLANTLWKNSLERRARFPYRRFRQST